MRFPSLFIATALIAITAVITGASRPGVQSHARDRLDEIRDRISKTSPEGLDVINRILQLRPVVNGMASAKRLAAIVEDYTLNKGNYSITPIGWEASEKKNGKWRVVLHYQDYEKQFQRAEWEYDPKTKNLYPFETKNAPGFWLSTRLISAPQRFQG